MTTLHEEPSSRQTLTEELEESDSDPEDDYDRVAYKPPLRSKFPMSKTMGSLSSYMSSNSITTPLSGNAINGMSTSDAIKAGTPSMTSSTSSGYDSQTVSSSNLTNDDSFSVQSISVDDTLGNFASKKVKSAGLTLLIPQVPLHRKLNHNRPHSHRATARNVSIHS